MTARNIARYRGRSIVEMTPAELRQALADTIDRLDPVAPARAPARGITVEQLGTRRLDEALRRAREP